MKNTKFTSFFLATIILVSAFSSCANPNEKTSLDNASQMPSESKKTESTAEKAEQIDLSALTENELCKFEGNIVESLKDDSVSEIEVNIFLKNIMSEEEYNSKVDAQVKINEEKYAAIKTEIESLQEQRREIYKFGEKNAEVDSIDKRIEELKSEREKYQPGYGYAVNIVIAEYHKPVLDEFIKKHGLPTNTSTTSAVLKIKRVVLTKEQLVQIAKDDSVLAISPPEDISNIKPFEYKSTSSDGVSLYTSGSNVDTQKLNEVYDIIDGETAINSGYSGSVVTVGIVDIGVCCS